MSYVLDGVTAGPGQQSVLENAHLTVALGAVTVCLGPNGVGKSTLLKLLAGELQPRAGLVTWDGQPLSGLSPEAQARRRAVLPQMSPLRFGFTVRTVVSLGRLPHGDEHAESGRAAVDRALAEHDLRALGDTRYPRLSGGEQQRVHAARAFAQVDRPMRAGTWLLLDEPTSALDLGHQHTLMARVRAHVAAGGGAFVVLHDPNLAADYADRVVLLDRDGRLSEGPAETQLAGAKLTRVYGTPIEVGEWRGRRVIRARIPS